MENHKIELNDGTQINAVLNGNNYIAAEKVENSLLTDTNVKGVKIDGEATAYETVLAHFADSEGDHIIFGSYTPEARMEKRIADLEDVIAAIAGGDQ